MAQLAALEAELASAYRSQFVGQTLQAIVEGPSRDGRPGWLARTDRYFTVTLDADGLRPGQVVLASVEGAAQGDKHTPARLVRVLADAQVGAARA
ncbi:MAG: TRAM domain-containing protein [Phycisphaerae bacterium]|nr:TRAM domain-containing protein [Phycisphaerae bacterium]